MKKIKGFSFDTVKDRKILEHLNNQTNQSGYIRELILKDINNSNIENIVEKFIKQYLNDKTITNHHKTNKTNENNNKIDINSALACMNIR